MVERGDRRVPRVNQDENSHPDRRAI